MLARAAEKNFGPLVKTKFVGPSYQRFVIFYQAQTSGPKRGPMELIQGT